MIRPRIVVPAGTQVYDPAGKVVAVAAADIEGSYIHPSQFVNYAGCPFDGRHVPIALEQLIVRVRNGGGSGEQSMPVERAR